MFSSKVIKLQLNTIGESVGLGSLSYRDFNVLGADKDRFLICAKFGKDNVSVQAVVTKNEIYLTSPTGNFIATMKENSSIGNIFKNNYPLLSDNQGFVLAIRDCIEIDDTTSKINVIEHKKALDILRKFICSPAIKMELELLHEAYFLSDGVLPCSYATVMVLNTLLNRSSIKNLILAKAVPGMHCFGDAENV